MIDIRPYVKRDRCTLVSVIDTVCGQSPWMETTHFVPTAGWQHALASPTCPNHLLLVLDTGRVSGWCRIFPTGSDSLTCSRQDQAALGIGILEVFRNQGLGRQLVTQALSWARMTGFHSVSLTTHPDNWPAIRLFAHSGFCLSGASPAALEMACDLRRTAV